ncbi:MAG: hypothetical protein AB1810_10295 [Pseudomonadota bacterium]
MIELRIGTAVDVDAIKLIPIESIKTDSFHGHGWYVRKEVFAIIVSSDEKLYAFDMEGKEMSMDELVAKLPELGEIL